VVPGGGFYVTADIGETDEERAGEKILRESHILVHPGYFYEIKPNHLVFSFAHEPSAIRRAVPVVLRAAGMCRESQ
jgi:aspartate/methionine/tyrosine aminotransferase